MNGPSSDTPLISTADYLRIHSVIRSVLDSVRAHTSEACVFFSLVGTYLLEKHHNLTAYPRAGAAFYSLGGAPKPNVITFAQFGEYDVESTSTAFHCWVECQGWIMDFMAPIFQENLSRQGLDMAVPPRMFQRQISTMGDSWSDLLNDGDFFLIPNPALAAKVFGQSIKKASIGDLAEICAHWYRPTPKEIEPSIQMASSDRSVVSIELNCPTIVGNW